MAKLKLNDAVIEKARKYIAAGNYAIVVCQYLGISQKTYYEWLKIGNDDIEKNKNTIYSKFCNTIKESEAEAEMRNITIIQKAASDTWQAAAWYLERKHKDRWSAKQELEHSGNVGVQIVDDIK